MSKATTDYAHHLALYEKLIAAHPEAERKGAMMPYTSLNGHMFSLFTKEGYLALRLPSAEREAFLKKYKTTLCEQYGVVMKEYVVAPTTQVEVKIPACSAIEGKSCDCMASLAGAAGW